MGDIAIVNSQPAGCPTNGIFNLKRKNLKWIAGDLMKDN